uniref:inositol polyphosphate-5-phosphatase A n=1 Tax=Panthera onca TaxID=9690 RepID=UPI002955A75A|nr:inositol polyphosphate-5-phosphatase A [Panthera onca]
MKEYNRARVYLDENFKSQEHFTALGSFYFLHESLKNIYQFDFKAKKYKKVTGKEIYSDTLESTPMLEKEKFPQDYFPEVRHGPPAPLARLPLRAHTSREHTSAFRACSGLGGAASERHRGELELREPPPRALGVPAAQSVARALLAHGFAAILLQLFVRRVLGRVLGTVARAPQLTLRGTGPPAEAGAAPPALEAVSRRKQRQGHGSGERCEPRARCVFKPTHRLTEDRPPTTALLTPPDGEHLASVRYGPVSGAPAPLVRMWDGLCWGQWPVSGDTGCGPLCAGTESLLCLSQTLCTQATMQTVRAADTNEVVKLIFRESDNDRKVMLQLEKKVFHYFNQEVFRDNNGTALLEFDKELSVFKDRLYELDISFPPSYPYSEDSGQGRQYMNTRCPAWCDRVLMSPSARELILKSESEEKVVTYDHIGPNVCMGDHKPVFLAFRIAPGAGKPHAHVHKCCVVQ